MSRQMTETSRALIAPDDERRQRLSVVQEPLRSNSPNWTSENAESSLPLSHYLWILRRHLWMIVGFVAISVAATFIISKRLTPLYESTATVDIDRRMPSGILGQDSMQSAVNDADQFLATQLKLIQSDSVLRPVVEQYHLRDSATDGQPVREARAIDAPVRLKQLRVARPPNTYLVLITYRSPDPKLAADVANAIARSYVEHTYTIRFRSSSSLSAFMEKQLEELRAKMERSGGALAQFEKELNVINPEEKTSILSARLLQLNTEYTNAQADRVRKEAAFRAVETGSVDAAQASTQGEGIKKLSEKLDEMSEKFVQVKAHYGPNHPEYRKAEAQLRQIERSFEAARHSAVARVEVEYSEAIQRETMLRKTVAETKAEFDRLNARSFEYQSLKREAEADKKLYEELVTKIKEAGINAGFQNSAIRIADTARPGLDAVSPNIRLNLLLAFAASLLLAIGAALLSDVLDRTVRDPEQVQRVLNTQVIASLPSVKFWRSTPAALITSANEKPHSRQLTDASSFSESIRTLRNSILLGDFDRNLRSLLFTSASPSEGKSTTAANLAWVHAQQGKRTLIIDGDLRRPALHKRFGVQPTMGLTNVLTEHLDWHQAVISIPDLPELSILPAGAPSRRASDLVGSGLSDILDEAARDYDLVLVDAPPLLGFAEPLQMAAAVDGVIIVTRAGRTERNAVAQVLTALERVRANVIGMVLNEVNRHLSDKYYYYYGHYGKYYKTTQGA